MRAKITSLSLLFLTAIIWGFAFVAQVDGVQYIGSFAMNGLRYPIGLISLLPVVLIFEKGRVDKAERKRTVIASVIAGTVLFCASTLQQLGIEYTGSAGVAGFITGLYTVLVPIGCFLMFKHKTGINVWIGAVCAVIGLFLLCYRVGDGLSFGYGELLLLIGSLFWTAHVIVIDKLGKSIRSLHFAWGQFAVCSALSVIVMLAFDRPTFSGIWEAKWALLYCGVLSVGIAYTLQIVAQKKADPTFAAIILSTESVFSAVGGAIFGIDSITWLGYVGCAIMFIGIVVSQIPLKKSKRIESKDTDIQTRQE